MTILKVNDHLGLVTNLLNEAAQLLQALTSLGDHLIIFDTSLRLQDKFTDLKV